MVSDTYKIDVTGREIEFVPLEVGAMMAVRPGAPLRSGIHTVLTWAELRELRHIVDELLESKP